MGPGDKSEAEYEWQPLKPGKVDEVTKAIDLAGNPSLAIRLEFHGDHATFDGEGLVDPQPEDDKPGTQVPLDSVVGPYVGEQIAGFNVQAAVVPEPGAWMLMLGGLSGIGLYRRRQEARR